MRRYGWLIGSLVGIVASVPIALGAQQWQEQREASDLVERRAADAYEDVVPEPIDMVRDLLAQDARVVVDPRLEGRIADEDLQRAEELLATSPVPARIAYLSYPNDLDIGYTSSGVGPQWWTNVGEDGHYVVLWDSGGNDVGAVGMEPAYLTARTQGQPGPALQRIAEEMVTWEATPIDDTPYEPGDFDYWSGVGGGIGAAVLFGVLVVAPVFLLLRWFVGSRRRKVT